jgi:uncharacterized membrane protein
MALAWGATGVTRRAILWLAIVLAAIAIEAQPAHAGFNVCNRFQGRIDVAFGYVDRQRGWMAQGWWVLDAGECKPVYPADLDNRYYYLFVKAVSGGVWSGDVPFCIQKKKFLLVQAEYGRNSPEECAKAGLENAQFFTVDVAGAKDHTYNLVATNYTVTPGRGPAGQSSQPPEATAPRPQVPYQPPSQTIQQGPPTYPTPPPKPYPQATQQPQPQPAPQPRPSPKPYPQPQQAQQPPIQQAPPQPAPQPNGGTACQRYPNLC